MGALLTQILHHKEDITMTTYAKLVKTAFQKKNFRIHALLGLLGVNFFEHGYDKSHKPLNAKEYFAVIKQAFALKKHRIRSLVGMLQSDFFDGDDFQHYYKKGHVCTTK